MINAETIKQVLTALKRFRALPRFGHKEDGSEEYACTPAGMEKAVKRAEAEGLTPILGSDCTLTLDLDDDREINPVVLAKLVQLWGEPKIETWRSKSGHGHHVLLTFRKAPENSDYSQEKNWQVGGEMPFEGFTEAEAMALEVALGSDPLRAVFGVARLKAQVERARVLFKPTTNVTHEHDLGSTDEPFRMERTAAA